MNVDRVLQLAEEDPLSFWTVLTIAQYIEYYEGAPDEAFQELWDLFAKYPEEFMALGKLTTYKERLGDRFIPLRSGVDSHNDTDMGALNC